MARRHRFHLPISTYHSMLRGNNGQDIFFSDADRVRFCLLLQQASERFNQNVEAFCIMSNHIHLAIRTSDISISKFMHYLAFRYARYINRKYKRVGHLFQGRFKSILVDDEKYLKELIRYIHLNPVRAHLVKDPVSYPWSSHKAYLDLIDIAWLSKDRVLNQFHPELEHAKANFNKYVLNGIGVKTEYDFKSGFVEGMIGDELFINNSKLFANIKKELKIELPKLIDYICRLYQISQEDFMSTKRTDILSEARALTACLVRNIDSLSLEQLAAYMGRDSSGLSKLANRLELKSYSDESKAKLLQDTKEKISTMSECQA